MLDVSLDLILCVCEALEHELDVAFADVLPKPKPKRRGSVDLGDD